MSLAGKRARALVVCGTAVFLTFPATLSARKGQHPNMSWKASDRSSYANPLQLTECCWDIFVRVQSVQRNGNRYHDRFVAKRPKCLRPSCLECEEFLLRG